MQAEDAGRSVDLSPDVFRSLGRKLVDELADYLERLADLPINPQASDSDIGGRLGTGKLPTDGLCPGSCARSSRVGLDISVGPDRSSPIPRLCWGAGCAVGGTVGAGGSGCESERQREACVPGRDLSREAGGVLVGFLGGFQDGGWSAPLRGNGRKPIGRWRQLASGVVGGNCRLGQGPRPSRPSSSTLRMRLTHGCKRRSACSDPSYLRFIGFDQTRWRWIHISGSSHRWRPGAC